MIGNDKIQITNIKQYPIIQSSNLEIPNDVSQIGFGTLNIGLWDLFGIY